MGFWQYTVHTLIPAACQTLCQCSARQLALLPPLLNLEHSRNVMCSVIAPFWNDGMLFYQTG